LIVTVVTVSLLSNKRAIKDSKYSFGRNWEKLLECLIALLITAKTWFGQLKNLSNSAVSLRIGHILNPLSLINHQLLTALEEFMSKHPLPVMSFLVLPSCCPKNQG